MTVQACWRTNIITQIVLGIQNNNGKKADEDVQFNCKKFNNEHVK